MGINRRLCRNSFYCTKECPASNITKQDIIRSKAKDLIFVSPLQRSTPHKLARELESMYKSGKTAEEEMSLRPRMLEGKLDEGIVSVNTAIDLITEVKSCEDIVKELMADFI
ncbi:nitronate monooxygenase [Bacillus inaquosorum]|nr:nitronate monooxygenase [Bacillus inaquosorum]MCY9408298.1 nitronate monooxygenase [Bacillus inaquosorum]